MLGREVVVWLFHCFIDLKVTRVGEQNSMCRSNITAFSVPKCVLPLQSPGSVSGGHSPGGFPEEAWHGARRSDRKKCRHNEGVSIDVQ